MAETALKKWGLSPETRAVVIAEALTIASSPESSPREKCSAMRVLLAADNVDAVRERTEKGDDSGQFVAIRFDKDGGGLRDVVAEVLREGYDG